MVLSVAEFAYNSLVNRSTGFSPFEIVTWYKPRNPIDLPPFPIGDWPSASAESFAYYLHDLHDYIHRQIVVSNDNYKSTAYLHKRLQKFVVGDEMMVRVRPKRFPQGTLKKLHARCIGLYRVLRKFGFNAYELEIP